MYTIICYKNTGFNAVNIPDTPALLESMDVILTQQVDVVQDRWLVSVRVKSAYDEIKDCDYCKVGDTYYVVDSVIMAAVDVAVLSLTMDAITTAGGPGALTFLDGITERHTTDDDEMWKYTEPDDYMAPSQPLQIESGRMEWDIPGDTANIVAVESTINLTKLAEQFTANSDGTYTFNGTGLPFYAEISGESESQHVDVPYTEGVSADATTAYRLGTDESVSVKSPNTRQWDVSKGNINLALGVVRSLAVESSIISQVVYPDGYITVNESSGGAIAVVTGKDQTTESGVPYKSNYGSNINNKRVYYGEYNKFGLLTASGESGEYLPEQICTNGETTDSEDGAPSVRVIADPRPTGKPYFRFVNYLNYATSANKLFWLSCVSGLQWANAPLTYQHASGSYQSRLSFNNGAKIAALDYNNKQNVLTDATAQSIGRAIISAIKEQASIISNSGKSLIGGLPGPSVPGASQMLGIAASAASAGMETGIAAHNYERDRTYNQNSYKLAREKELSQYAVSQSVVAPTVTFPFEANVIRDFVGNNLVVYKYRYTNQDAKRVDTLLTMYGYKDARRLNTSMFSNRTYFDYVRAHGISIGGNIAISLKAAITEQLGAGVRVWHVKPTPEYYTSGNPIRSTTT